MDNDKATLRRYEDDLNVSGIGVIILGAWSVLKVFMQLILEIKEDISFKEIEDGQRAIAIGVFVAMIAVIILIFFLIFKIHLYIGLNAARAARGEPYKKGYYKGAVILLVLSVFGLSAYVNDLKDIENIDTTIASFIVDLTTIYILWTIVSSTRKIRAFKELQRQE